MSTAPFVAKSHELTSCTLRSLEERDARSIAGALVSMEPWLSLGYTEDGLSRYLCRHDPALSRYSIWSGEELAGVVCVRFPWLRGPCLELLAVLSAMQGRGIGADVLSWMECECRLAAGNLWTLASSFNAAARGFYLHAGFCEVAVLPGLVAAGLDEILLRKEIRRP